MHFKKVIDHELPALQTLEQKRITVLVFSLTPSHGSYGLDKDSCNHQVGRVPPNICQPGQKTDQLPAKVIYRRGARLR